MLFCIISSMPKSVSSNYLVFSKPKLGTSFRAKTFVFVILPMVSVIWYSTYPPSKKSEQPRPGHVQVVHYVSLVSSG